MSEIVGKYAYLDHQDIQLFLNSLMKKGIFEFDLNVPLMGTLFKIKMKIDCIELISIDISEYNKRRTQLPTQYRNYDFPLFIPDHYNFCNQILFGSGFWNNWSSYKALLGWLTKGSYRDLLNGQKPLWIGYDNNILRNSIYFNFLRDIPEVVRSCGHVVANGVLTELFHRFEKKLKQKELEQFDALENETRDELLNGPTSAGRSALIGYIQARQITALQNSQTIEGKFGDDDIINSYSKFQMTSPKDVFLISCDKAFIEHAKAFRMNSFILRSKSNEIPINTLTGDYQNLSRLLWLTSILFFEVEVLNNRIYSIYRGQAGSDLQNMKVKYKLEPELKNDINNFLKALY